MARKKSEKGKSQKLVVEKRNIVNEATWLDPKHPAWHNPITKQAYIFFLLYLSKINPRDPNTQSLVISSDEYKGIMDFQHLNHDQIGKAVSLLFDLKIVIPGADVEGSVFHVFKRLDYKVDPETRKFVFTFVPDMEIIPYIFKINSNYLTYDLKNVVALNSLHQIRFYEFIKQREYQKDFAVTLEYLKQQLYIDADDYKAFDLLRKKIIAPCQKALEKSTDVRFTYELHDVVGHGKVIRLKFHVFKAGKEEAAGQQAQEAWQEEAAGQWQGAWQEECSGQQAQGAWQEEAAGQWQGAWQEEAACAGPEAPPPAPRKGIRDLLAFMGPPAVDREFTDYELAAIYEDARGDVEWIRECMRYALTQMGPRESFVGTMRWAVKKPRDYFRQKNMRGGASPRNEKIHNFMERDNEEKYDALLRLEEHRMVDDYNRDALAEGREPIALGGGGGPSGG